MTRRGLSFVMFSSPLPSYIACICVCVCVCVCVCICMVFVEKDNACCRYGMMPVPGTYLLQEELNPRVNSTRNLLQSRRDHAPGGNAKLGVSTWDFSGCPEIVDYRRLGYEEFKSALQQQLPGVNRGTGASEHSS